MRKKLSAGDKADSPAPQLRQRPESAFIPIGDLIHEIGAVTEEKLLTPGLKPLHPAPFRIPWFSKYVAGTFIAMIQFGAHQNAVPKFKSSQMVLDAAQVVIVKLPGKHAEECRKAFGAKFGAMLIGNLPEPLEQIHDLLDHFDGPTQHPFGVLAPTPDLLLAFDRLHGNGVHLPDDGGSFQAIGKDVLAIEDRLRFIEARQDGPLHYFEQELVPGGHRAEQRVQLQVLRQRRFVR
jgi:hypothetical protein